MSDHPQTSVSVNVFPRVGEVVARQAQSNPQTVWLAFGDLGTTASVFLNLQTIPVIRDALADAERMLTDEAERRLNLPTKPLAGA